MSDHPDERRMLKERARELSRAQARRALLWTVIRCVVGVALVLVGYYLVTFDDRRPTGNLAWLEIVLGGLLFVGVLIVEVRAIARAPYPILRALEATVVALFLFIVIFATAYLTLSHVDEHSFTEHLDRTAALYFTIVTLGTVGYGDISPATQPARLFVSLQILLDLVFLAVLLRVVIAAARRGLTREGPMDEPETPHE